jgi:hypothetical protein
MPANKSASKSLVRNLCRINVSQILYTRGCFAPSDFEDREVNGVTVKALGGETCSIEASQMIAWLEDGIFDAVSRQDMSYTCPDRRLQPRTCVERFHGRLIGSLLADHQGLSRKVLAMHLGG